VLLTWDQFVYFVRPANQPFAFETNIKSNQVLRFEVESNL